MGQVRGRHFRMFAAIAGVALAVGVVGSAIAAQLASGVDSYTGCLTTSGDLSKFAKGSSPAKSCTGSQVQVSFSGPLPSGCAEGDVLAWSSGVWTCAAAGEPDVFVKLRPSSAFIPPGNNFVQIATLDLQPGNYAVTGRVVLTSRGVATDPPFSFYCNLIPANDDGTPGSISSFGSDSATGRLAPLNTAGDSENVALFVSQTLSQPGTVVLGCNGSGNASGADARYVAIRAIRVGTITTDIGPGPLP